MNKKKLFNILRNHIASSLIGNLSKKDKKYILDYTSKNRILFHVLPHLEFDNQTTEFKDKKRLLKYFNLYHLTYMNDVSILNKIFKTHSINPIFLKGAFFNLKGIKNRYCSDIDILVRSEELPKIRQIINDSDFFVKNDNNLNIIENSHQTDTLKTLNGSTIDLHYRLTSPIFTKNNECTLTKRVFDNAEEVVFGGDKYLCPSLEDAYLHVSYHALIHDKYSTGPIYFYDLAYFKNLHMNANHFHNLNFYEQESFQNLIALSLNIANELGINFGYKFKSVPEKYLNYSIHLILAGHKIRDLNKNYDTKRFKDSLKGINIKSLNFKIKNFAIYLFTVLVNFRRWRMIKKINKFLVNNI